MNIEKLKSGSYRIRQYYQGQRICVTVKEKPTDSQAIELMAEAIKKYKEKNPEIDSFAAAYETYLKSRSNELSPSTIRGYEGIIRNLPEWFKGKNVYKITELDVQNLVNEIAEEHSPKTVRNAHGLVSAVLKKTRRTLVLDTTLPQRKREDVYIPTDKEVKAILQEVKGTKYEVALWLAVYGLRRSEICALTIDDLEGNMISVSKAKVQRPDGSWTIKDTPKTEESNRKVYVTDYVRDLILKQGYIYQGHPEHIKTKLEATEKKLGIRHFTLHKMRHYFASLCHEMGFSDAETEAMGGWKSDYIMKRVYRHARAEKVSDSQLKFAEKTEQFTS